MSYIRPLCPYTYIEGENDGDYIYAYNDKEGKEYLSQSGMETKTAIDILFNELNNKEGNLILITCLNALCDNLNIKIRKKPLTFEEFFKLQYKIHERFHKERRNLSTSGVRK